MISKISKEGQGKFNSASEITPLVKIICLYVDFQESRSNEIIIIKRKSAGIKIWHQKLDTWSKIKVCTSKNQQKSHDGPEIAHLYIGLRGWANFDHRAFI
jgi:hypothetical protein